MHRHILLSIVCAAGSLACSGAEPVNIGEDTPVRTGEFLSDYAASWDGYVEAYQFDSGSDRLRITLDSAGVGHVEFGEMPELPPPTDPDVGWGPKVGDPDASRSDYANELAEGYRYSARAVTVEDSRLRLAVHVPELYGPWCELQTPVADETNDGITVYSCVPNVGVLTMRKTNECFLHLPEGDEAVDCDKLDLCRSRVCNCDAEGCGAVPPPSESSEDFGTHLDGALQDEGDSLVGTLLTQGERLTVRLTRN